MGRSSLGKALVMIADLWAEEATEQAFIHFLDRLLMLVADTATGARWPPTAWLPLDQVQPLHHSNGTQMVTLAARRDVAEGLDQTTQALVERILSNRHAAAGPASPPTTYVRRNINVAAGMGHSGVAPPATPAAFAGQYRLQKPRGGPGRGKAKEPRRKQKRAAPAAEPRAGHLFDERAWVDRTKQAMLHERLKRLNADLEGAGVDLETLTLELEEKAIAAEAGGDRRTLPSKDLVTRRPGFTHDSRRRWQNAHRAEIAHLWVEAALGSPRKSRQGRKRAADHLRAADAPTGSLHLPKLPSEAALAAAAEGPGGGAPPPRSRVPPIYYMQQESMQRQTKVFSTDNPGLFRQFPFLARDRFALELEAEAAAAARAARKREAAPPAAADAGPALADGLPLSAKMRKEKPTGAWMRRGYEPPDFDD